MHSLRELLKRSQENRAAIGHFNVSGLIESGICRGPGVERAGSGRLVRGRA
jgi:hypothetical protein